MSLTLSSLTIISKGGAYGLQDEKGDIVVPCIYTNILDFDGDGYIRVLKDEVYGAQNEAYMCRSAENVVRRLCFNELCVNG